MSQILTRQDVVKFFTRNKKSKIVFEQKVYFWDSWKITNFSQEPLINNILSCVLFATDELKYNKHGFVSEEQIEDVKNILLDKNLQQNIWSKKKIFECININNVNNDFFLFLCQEFYINIFICSELGLKIYYINDEFDIHIPTIVLKSNTDDITKQLYYQIIYLENKLISQDELSLFLNYQDKFIIGIDKNKKLKLKNYSLVENDIDIFHMDKRKELDHEVGYDNNNLNKLDEELYNEFEEI
jgi:hypothetical protein